MVLSALDDLGQIALEVLKGLLEQLLLRAGVLRRARRRCV